MARNPYRIARQEHLGDMLDELQRRGRLSWRWEYDKARHRAIYWVERQGPSIPLETQAAEELAQAECDALGIRWLPVPHPAAKTDEPRPTAGSPRATRS